MFISQYYTTCAHTAKANLVRSFLVDVGNKSRVEFYNGFNIRI